MDDSYRRKPTSRWDPITRRRSWYCSFAVRGRARTGSRSTILKPSTTARPRPPSRSRWSATRSPTHLRAPNLGWG
ncbi:hypothetical protein TIFTF001_009613 [Ficus carica]|uniref:Uncharacterized protein n=1 Tax=Ficus carica TaxID=3494 RepID=A0AA87ZVA9_FICCA|nr:hypothetical protein TIFTF001_009613 [Ficus carica]